MHEAIGYLKERSLVTLAVSDLIMVVVGLCFSKFVFYHIPLGFENIMVNLELRLAPLSLQLAATLLGEGDLYGVPWDSWPINNMRNFHGSVRIHQLSKDRVILIN